METLIWQTRRLPQGLILNAFHGAVLTVVCIGVMPAFLKMYTNDTEIIPAAFILSRLIGAEEVWYAFVVSERVAAVADVFIYRLVVEKN